MQGIASLTFDYNTMEDSGNISLGWFNRYFRSIIQGQTGKEYAVFFPRRCFNMEYLAELMFQEEMKSDQSPIMLSTIGWFPYAETYADIYLSEGRFPGTILVDDIIVHGRIIQSTQDQFLSIVLFFLHQKAESINEEEVKRAFCDVTDTVVFSRNNTRSVLDSEYEQKVNCFLPCKTEEWHQFALDVTEFIKAGPFSIPYTSYILSAEIPKGKLKATKSWKHFTFQCSNEDNHDKGKQFWILNCDYGSKKGEGEWDSARAMVRISKSAEQEIFLSPYFVHGTVRDIGHLMHVVAKLSEDYHLVGLHKMAASYSNKLPAPLIECYCMMVDMLISQIALSIFLSDNGLEHKDVVYDIDKIHRSFSYWIRKEELEKITIIKWKAEDYQTLYLAYGKEPLLPLLTSDRDCVETDNDHIVLERCQNITELLGVRGELAALGVIQEKQYCNRIPKDGIPKCSKASEMLLWDFLKACIEDNKEHLISNLEQGSPLRCSSAQLLAAIFCLMDDDYLSLRVKVEKTEDNRGLPTATLKLKHTEMSISLYAKRLTVFWDAYIRLMRYCKRMNTKYSQNICLFIEALLNDPSLQKQCEEVGINIDLKQICEDMIFLTILTRRYSELFKPLLSWKYPLPKTWVPLEKELVKKAFNTV